MEQSSPAAHQGERRRGPEMLLRQSSDLQGQEIVNTNFGGDTGDAFEAHEWRYVRTFNGIRIFEDISITNPKVGKVILLKSVGVVEIQEGFCFLSTMVSWTRWSI
ncbi:hypothetical protein ZEAMMB73_Zm00001d032168 [Zea mays]|uniref:Uncharacterized protein n=1 Tax=Zea mays TaxID=4577 RepID=A0A1D6KNX7_MAIZE|nr:hypothetical protein ZEAMMB73_Zm00001d032168 [Zea mays]